MESMVYKAALASVDVARAACPTQKIETMDMPRSEAHASGQTTFMEMSTHRAGGLTKNSSTSLEADFCLYQGDV